MNWLVLLEIAFRNLSFHKMRAILTIGGVAIGISAIIFLVSLGYGLEQLVTNQLVSNLDSLKVIDVSTTNYKTNKINSEIVTKIKDLPNVTDVMAVTNIPSRISGATNKSVAETLIISGDAKYFNYTGMILSKGRFPSEKKEIVISRNVLGLINETEQSILNHDISMELIIPSNSLSNQEAPASSLKDQVFRVTGIVDNNSTAIAYISDKNNDDFQIVNYSAMKVKISSKDKASTIRQQIEGFNLKTSYIGDTVNQVSEVFMLFRFVLAAFGLIALIVASLGTFNILTISLMERTKEVGLLKALGMRNKDIYRLFASESIIIGIVGGIAGLLIGILVSQGLNFALIEIAKKVGAEPIGLFITPVNFAAWVGFFSIIVGFLTGLYPSIRAVKINPLDALRYE